MMDVLNFLLSIVQLIVFGALLIVVGTCVGLIVLGALGIGLCEIEYDEEDRKPRT